MNPPLIVIKPSALAQQCVDYILHHNHSPEYTTWDIQWKIVWPYFNYSPGIDPVMLVAQLIHETGNLTSWWSGRPRRNPAGIGVTGRTVIGDQPKPKGKWVLKDGFWHEGNSYGDWTDAVHAHIGRVLCYRFTVLGGDSHQRVLMNIANDDRTFPPKHRGKYKNWYDLNGIWSLSPTYAQQIERIAEAIREVD